MTMPPPHDPNANLRTAGTVAIWVWVLLAAVPLVVILACTAMCILGSIGNAVDPVD